MPGGSLSRCRWKTSIGAREVLSDRDKRIRADAASLNLDTADGVLRDLTEHFGPGESAARCKLMDVEKDLLDYALPVELPGLEEVKASIVVPDVPEEMPAARVYWKNS